VTALALIGWALTVALAAAAASMRRRLAFVADAEHELRGALSSLELAIEAAQPPSVLAVDLARARGGLEDLSRARGAANRTTAVASREAVAQVLCNLLDNAAEHGGGPVVVRAGRARGGLNIEVSDSGPGFRRRRLHLRRNGRGRGLGIVRRVVRDSGGALAVSAREQGTTVAVELPLADRAA